GGCACSVAVHTSATATHDIADATRSRRKQVTTHLRMIDSIFRSKVQGLEIVTALLEADANQQDENVQEQEREDAEPERSSHQRRERRDNGGLRMERPPHVDRPVDERDVRHAENP